VIPISNINRLEDDQHEPMPKRMRLNEAPQQSSSNMINRVNAHETLENAPRHDQYEETE
jgi:hypothetical protein